MLETASRPDPKVENTFSRLYDRVMNNPDWAEGYVTDTTYADHFFRELSPAWLNYVAALNGIQPRTLKGAFTYLELGCGFGTSALIHAAAFPQGQFHAYDLNHAHIATANERAVALGVDNIAFQQAAFQELAAGNLPQFDYIVLHGVYSWVGVEARRAIRKIIAERLKPGGLVYLSYNCLPGWALETPVRKLLVELVDTEEGDIEQRTEHALQQLKDLSDSKLRYFKANPAISAAIDSYISGPTKYVIHEFLNQAWKPFYSIDIADEMAAAGTRYVGSATLAENHPALMVSEQYFDALAKLATGRQRHLAMDFAVDRRFRRDVFVRGTGEAESPEAGRYLGEVVIGTLGDPEAISPQIKVPRGVVTFQQDFIRDLQVLMRGSMTIEKAVARLSTKGKDIPEIIRNLTYLIAGGALMPFAHSSPGAQLSALEHRFDERLSRVLDNIIEHRIQPVIPSTTAGNGIPVTAIEALAIKEWVTGNKTVEKLAAALATKIPQLRVETTPGKTAGQAGSDLAKYSRSAAENVLESVIPNLARLGLIT